MEVCLIVDWLKIKAEYITNEDASYRKLAKKYKVSESTLYKRAKTEDWFNAKQQHKRNSVAKAVAILEEDQTERLVHLLRVTDTLLDKIEELVNSLQKEDLFVDKRGLKDLTGAIKDIKDIQSVKSKMDIQEQQARIDKLRKDAEDKSDTPQAITITIEGGESAWQE